MTAAAPHSFNGVRLNEAAVWHAKLHADSCGEATWAEFTVWLEADSANRIAFDLVEDLYANLDEARTLMPHLAQHEAQTRITRLASWHAVRNLPIRTVAAGLALLAASVTVTIGMNRLHVAPQSLEYATRIGETKTVTLADGSVVEMNTGSTIAVMFGNSERRVELDHGEAVFRVAKDSAHPFLLTVGDRDVRDVGTVFNVLHDSERIVVTVAEGKVAVSPRDRRQPDDGTAVQLSAGDQLVIQEGANPAVHQVDPALVMTWRQGYLTFKDAPLALVVSDLNRYFSNHIILKDHDTGRRRFSGVLKIDNEDAVVNRLTELLPLVADRAADGSVILRSKPQAE